MLARSHGASQRTRAAPAHDNAFFARERMQASLQKVRGNPIIASVSDPLAPGAQRTPDGRIGIATITYKGEIQDFKVAIVAPPQLSPTSRSRRSWPSRRAARARSRRRSCSSACAASCCREPEAQTGAWRSNASSPGLRGTWVARSALS